MESLESAVHAIHDAYLIEIVEGHGLCPFAKRAREAGRIERPLLFCREQLPNLEAVTFAFTQARDKHPVPEIILLTFIAEDFSWPSGEAFEAYANTLRSNLAALGEPSYFMVPFHPEFTQSASSRGPQGLVRALRRAPDPVIQCVHAQTLSQARNQAQRSAEERLRKQLASADPRLQALLARSIQADSTLSADIAKRNFDSVGSGLGRDRLEASYAHLMEQRTLRYQASRSTQ